MIELNSEERTECEIWTRCMGYFRPVSFFNKGKQAEFAERKYFKVSKCAPTQIEVNALKARKSEMFAPKNVVAMKAKEKTPTLTKTWSSAPVKLKVSVG